MGKSLGARSGRDYRGRQEAKGGTSFGGEQRETTGGVVRQGARGCVRRSAGNMEETAGAPVGTGRGKASTSCPAGNKWNAEEASVVGRGTSRARGRPSSGRNGVSVIRQGAKKGKGGVVRWKVAGAKEVPVVW